MRPLSLGALLVLLAACTNHEGASAAGEARANDAGAATSKEGGARAPEPSAEGEDTGDPFCTDLTVRGEPVPFTPVDRADGGDGGDGGAPAATGGTIVPGTYVLTQSLQYGAAAPIASQRETIRFLDDGGYEQASEESIVFAALGIYSTSGTLLTMQATCASGRDAKSVPKTPHATPYDAAGNELRLHVDFAGTHDVYVYVGTPSTSY